MKANLEIKIGKARALPPYDRISLDNQRSIYIQFYFLGEKTAYPNPLRYLFMMNTNIKSALNSFEGIIPALWKLTNALRLIRIILHILSVEGWKSKGNAFPKTIEEL